MTDVEIRLLRALCRSDHKTYLPRGASLERFQRFDELVAILKRMKRAGWIELEVAGIRGAQVGTHRRRYRAATARCTDRGRDALRTRGAPG